MYCTSCGNKLEENSNFCTKCGNKIDNSNQVSNNKNNSVSIVKCILQAVGVGIGIFILLWMIKMFLNLYFGINISGTSFDTVITVIQIVLPIFIIIFGPWILYAIKVFRKK